MALTLRCRSWSCPCCAVRLRARNRARALRGARGKVAMVTLTIDPGTLRLGTGPDAVTRGSVRLASESWNRLRLILRREFGPLDYYKGLELTKAGVAHLHVIARVETVADFWRLRAIVRRNVERAGFGTVVHSDLARSSEAVVRYVTKADAVAYGSAPSTARRPAEARRTSASARGSSVAAYATKGVDGRFPRHARRGSWSRSWCEWTRSTAIAGFSWQVAHAARAFVVDGLMASDFVVVEPDRFRIRAAAPPGVTA